MDGHRSVITHINLQKGFRGGERQTLLLIEALMTKKIKQQIVLRSGSELHTRSRHIQGLHIIPIRKPYMLSLSKVAGSDLLHAHEAKAAQWSYLVKKRFGIPYVITRRVTHRPKGNMFTRAVYSQAACIIALSKAIREVLHSYQVSLPVQRIPSMYNPAEIDDDKVVALRRQYRGKYLIGHIGELIKLHKGQDMLIEAARKLVTYHPHMHFMFVGDGRDKSKLIQQAGTINQIEFVGFQQEVQNYLAAFDLFAFPSLHEGLGSSVIDAMHNRLPIVASSIEGITDLIQHKVNGLLVPSRSVDELADAINTLYKSPGLAAQLGQQAYMSSERYSQERVSEEVFSIYQNILTLRY